MILVAKLSVIKCLHSNKNSELCSLFLFLLKVSLAVIGLCLLSACQPPQVPEPKQKRVYSGPIMGTQYRVIVIDGVGLPVDGGLSAEGISSNNARQAVIDNAIVSAMNSVNGSMSTYISDSELNQFNALPGGQVMTLSDGLAEVVVEALSIGDMSNGAFDITLAGAVNLWGFGPNGKIDSAPSESLSKSVDGVTIDLSAIAKGYAVDQVALSLERLGVNDYLVDIGGELRASGHSARGQAWRVGVEKPHVLGGVQDVIALQDKAIATSGDYRNYHLIDGKHYSHTISAKTLTPVFHRLALVSVIADKTSTADALATAIMAMGEQEGYDFAVEHGLTVYMVVRGKSENDYEIKMTGGFRDYLQ